MTEQIPAEAVEAAAQVLCEDDFGRAAWARLEAGTRKMTFARYCGVARRALAAALPHLAQHARVARYVEEVARVLSEPEPVEQVCGWRFPLPGWAGEDQMDPCTCDLPKGHAPADHKSGHECEHIRAKRIARGEAKEDDRG